MARRLVWPAIGHTEPMAPLALLLHHKRDRHGHCATAAAACSLAGSQQRQTTDQPAWLHSGLYAASWPPNLQPPLITESLRSSVNSRAGSSVPLARSLATQSHWLRSLLCLTLCACAHSWLARCQRLARSARANQNGRQAASTQRVPLHSLCHSNLQSRAFGPTRPGGAARAPRQE